MITQETLAVVGFILIGAILLWGRQKRVPDWR